MSRKHNRGHLLALYLISASILLLTLALLTNPARLNAQNATRTPTITSTATTTAAGSVTPTATRRAGLGARQTPTPTTTATITPTATPTPASQVPLPSPLALAILPAPSVKHRLAGDVVSAADVPVSISYPVLFEDQLDFWMQNVRDLSVGDEPGAGIAFVRFIIVDQQGNVVHAQEATQGPPFCAFPQPAAVVRSEICLPWDFATNGERWPMRRAALGGHYTLVAFAQGAEPDHKGAWTLPFELRLSSEGLGDTDGAVRFRSVKRTDDALLVQVETFGFTPFMFGTHLHFYADGRAEEEAVGGTGGVVDYPAAYNLPGAYGSGEITLSLDALGLGGAYAPSSAELCVVIAHPDESVLVGRGECVSVP